MIDDQSALNEGFLEGQTQTQINALKLALFRLEQLKIGLIRQFSRRQQTPDQDTGNK